jgi:hypothetical protein
MWGFSTTQTLIAMANLLNQQQQPYVDQRDYLQMFSTYVASHRLRLPNGKTIPWVDEAMDAETGEWITRNLLIERQSPLIGRGAYYDHSGFSDPLITGLIGVRPRSDNLLVVHPLLPAGAWSYFALDGLPYHGHMLTIFYDATGHRYHRGKGLTILVDGRQVASRENLAEVRVLLPSLK